MPRGFRNSDEEPDEFAGDAANHLFGDGPEESGDDAQYDFSDEIYERHAEIIDRLNAIDGCLQRLEKALIK